MVNPLQTVCESLPMGDTGVTKVALVLGTSQAGSACQPGGQVPNYHVTEESKCQE